MKDLKYIAAYTVPLSAIIGLLLKGYWSYLTPVYLFVFIPFLELIFPLDTNNYSEEDVANRKLNRFFDWIVK